MTIDAAFTHFPCLTTRRLQLRQIRLDDAEAFFTTLSDTQVTQFYGHDPHQSLQDSQDLIKKTQIYYNERKSIRWAITLLNEENMLGSCSLHRFDTNFHRAETGYELNRSFWQQGIMTEAMSAILTYGFNELALHRVEAITDSANIRSKSLLLRLGFTYEGNLRQRFFFHNHFADEYCFGLLKDEWYGLRS